jgi:hypothetical protein
MLPGSGSTWWGRAAARPGNGTGWCEANNSTVPSAVCGSLVGSAITCANWCAAWPPARPAWDPPAVRFHEHHHQAVGGDARGQVGHELTCAQCPRQVAVRERVHHRHRVSRRSARTNRRGSAISSGSRQAGTTRGATPRPPRCRVPHAHAPARARERQRQRAPAQAPAPAWSRGPVRMSLRSSRAEAPRCTPSPLSVSTTARMPPSATR